MSLRKQIIAPEPVMLEALRKRPKLWPFPTPIRDRLMEFGFEISRELRRPETKADIGISIVHSLLSTLVSETFFRGVATPLRRRFLEWMR